MSSFYKPISITPGEEFGPLEIICQNYDGSPISFEGCTVVAQAWEAMDTLPLSANNDFDTMTLFVSGAMINGVVEITKYEEFEGN